MKSANTDKIIELVRRFGVIRPRDLDKFDIPRRYMSRLYKKGVLERVGRGLYVIPDAEPTEHHTLSLVSKQIPHAVVCLLSALQFHNLTSQNPYQVWIAINSTARRPRAPELPMAPPPRPPAPGLRSVRVLRRLDQAGMAGFLPGPLLASLQADW